MKNEKKKNSKRRRYPQNFKISGIFQKSWTITNFGNFSKIIELEISDKKYQNF